MSINIDRILSETLKQGNKAYSKLNKDTIEKMYKYEESKSARLKVSERNSYKKWGLATISFLVGLIIFKDPILSCANAIYEVVLDKYEIMKYAGLVDNDSLAITRSEEGYIVSLEELCYSDHEVVASISIVGDGIGDFMRNQRVTQSAMIASFDNGEEGKIFRNQASTRIIDNISLRETLFGDTVNAQNYNYSDYYNVSVSWRGDKFLFKEKTIPLNIAIKTPSDEYEEVAIQVEFNKDLYFEEDVIELNASGNYDGIDYTVTKVVDTMSGLALFVETNAAYPENFFELKKEKEEILYDCKISGEDSKEKIVYYNISDKEHYPTYYLDIANSDNNEEVNGEFLDGTKRLTIDFQNK